MVRPVGAPHSKNLGLSFAVSCTVNDADPFQTVGRAGSHSLFDVFSKVFPQCSRTFNTKSGISNIELNKLLEADSGFTRQRYRHGSKGQHGTGATYRFGLRRWYDPDDANEARLLERAWDFLSSMQRPSISFQSFLQVVRECRKSDAEAREIMHRIKSRKAEVEPSSSPTSTTSDSGQSTTFSANQDLFIHLPEPSVDSSRANRKDAEETSSATAFPQSIDHWRQPEPYKSVRGISTGCEPHGVSGVSSGFGVQPQAFKMTRPQAVGVCDPFDGMVELEDAPEVSDKVVLDLLAW